MAPSPESSSDQSSATRYLEPGWATRRLFDPVMRWLTERGISVLGTRVLEVRGRRSGQVRSTVVNLVEHDGAVYLVAPRGTTQWVRNLRAAAGSGRLRLGRRTTAFAATELADDEKGPVLQAYLRRWWWEVGQFFEGVDRHAGEQELAEIAPGFPVFRIGMSER
jgi:deazaflavin-dependent oxidoreductase (nitroreductase family)